jgi:hypothetical protein
MPVTTGIAGILHFRLFFNGLDRGINDIGLFFLLSGVLQLFWVIPMIRRWGRPWYYFGLVGTIVLIILWVMTRKNFLHKKRAGTEFNLDLSILPSTI